ncbi:hypothetical protein KJ877_03480 [bacterium]|nr:hypothetical protein [bacterium]MBU1990571.1 hypothetical protein [bacterium]
MNRINPLYIGVLLLIILGFLVFKLNGSKADLIEAKELYKETLKVSTELNGLKNVYDQSKKTSNAIQAVLKHTSLQSAKIEQKVKNSGITISSESMDAKSLNILMSKLLNGAYNITSFKIKKLSDTKTSFYMEIKW